MSKTEETVRRIAEDLILAFQTGAIPAALAKVFVKKNIDVPSSKWTWTNRLLGILRGHVYAAGFRQWEALGRQVRKGEKCFHILGPRLQKVEDEKDDGNRTILLGYYSIPVFGYHQTDGKPLPGAEDEPTFVNELPLIEVARSWHLKVDTYSIRDNPRALGVYVHGKAINLATESRLVWAHELIHAADHRLGSLIGEKLLTEVVAQLGGSVLLRCLGQYEESDPGFAYEYIEQYCSKYKKKVAAVCTQVLDRTCNAVSLLLHEGERIANGLPPR